MELNWNPRVFICQYAKKNMNRHCNLFQMSLTNRGIGYTFNQVDFWDQYISTWYTKEFSKVYRPKGFKNSDSKDNIFYPVRSGPKDGLTVNDN